MQVLDWGVAYEINDDTGTLLRSTLPSSSYDTEGVWHTDPILEGHASWLIVFKKQKLRMYLGF